MEKRLKEYKAVIWTDATKPGIRVTILAENGEEAERRLREEYGREARMSIRNEEDARRIR